MFWKIIFIPWIRYQTVIEEDSRFEDNLIVCFGQTCENILQSQIIFINKDLSVKRPLRRSQLSVAATKRMLSEVVLGVFRVALISSILTSSSKQKVWHAFYTTNKPTVMHQLKTFRFPIRFKSVSAKKNDRIEVVARYHFWD